tara:strand:+ start:229 stop:498 length:270 start_codon:yes stop_codon:yes gene_type:complete
VSCERDFEITGLQIDPTKGVTDTTPQMASVIEDATHVLNNDIVKSLWLGISPTLPFRVENKWKIKLDNGFHLVLLCNGQNGRAIQPNNE